MKGPVSLKNVTLLKVKSMHPGPEYPWILSKDDYFNDPRDLRINLYKGSLGIYEIIHIPSNLSTRYVCDEIDLSCVGACRPALNELVKKVKSMKK